MKNVKLKFNDTWVDVEDGWLCIGDSENQILLKPEFFNKLLAAINYTHSCTELKGKDIIAFHVFAEINKYAKCFEGYKRDGKTFSETEVLKRYNTYLQSL